MLLVAYPLYSGTVYIDEDSRDLLERVNPDLPTFINLRNCIAFYWTGVKEGNAPLTYTVSGRNSTDWEWSHTGQITGLAGQWFRVVIKPPRAYDQYRIEVSGGTQRLHSKIIVVEEVFE